MSPSGVSSFSARIDNASPELRSPGACPRDTACAENASSSSSIIDAMCSRSQRATCGGCIQNGGVESGLTRMISPTSPVSSSSSSTIAPCGSTIRALSAFPMCELIVVYARFKLTCNWRQSFRNVSPFHVPARRVWMNVRRFSSWSHGNGHSCSSTTLSPMTCTTTPGQSPHGRS